MAEMKTLWFKGDADADWHPVALHAVDAAHALEVDSAHWRQDKPEAEVVAEPEPDPVDLDPPASTEEGTEQ